MHVPLAVDLHLTPVVNPQTQTVLLGLEVERGLGDNSAHIKWLAANAGDVPTDPLDRNGLFQGAMYDDTGELIATVYVRLALP